MTVPFMRAYTERLVQVCHQHGAHAMGGMAAFIPSRKDENVNKIAYEKVRQDKEREVADGFDGTWVAHPDLVPFAKEIFMKVKSYQQYFFNKRFFQLVLKVYSKTGILSSANRSSPILYNFQIPSLDTLPQRVQRNLPGLGH